MRSTITLVVDHDEHTDGVQMLAEWTMYQTQSPLLWDDVTVVDYTVNIDIPVPAPVVDWTECNRECSPLTLTDRQWHQATHPDAGHYKNCSAWAFR